MESLVVEAAAEEWRDWSSLPKDILLSIVSFLVTLADLSSFTAVCQSWRSSSTVFSSLTMSSQSPLTLLYHGGTRYFFDATHRRIYRSPLLPSEIRKFRIYGYTHGYLVASPRKCYSSLLLVDFFTGTKTKLPRVPTTDDFVHEHLLLSSSPSSLGCFAVLLGSSHCFLYCRPGVDPHWTRYQFSPTGYVGDVVFVGNKLYVITTDGRLGFFSFVPHPVFTVLEAISVNAVANSRWYLTESAGELLAIRWVTYDFRHEYDIWRWELVGGCGFVKISSLGERALFFANGLLAGSLTASVRSGVTRNCIYQIECHDCWVYSLDTKRTVDIFHTSPRYFRYDTMPVWILLPFQTSVSTMYCN